MTTDDTQRGPADLWGRPYDPDVVQGKVRERAEKHRLTGPVASPAQMGLALGALEMCFAPDSDSDRKRRTLARWLTGHEPISGPDCLALLDWLAPAKDSGDAWGVPAVAVAEARAAFQQAMIDAGQLALPL